MTAFILAFAGVSLALGLFVWLVGRTDSAVAGLIAGALLVFFGLLYAGVGYPVPVELVHPEGVVVARVLQKGEAIWIWVRSPGSEPRAFKLPWSEEVAAQLEGAMRSGARQTRVGFDSNSESLVFHPIPQPADPPKE